MSSTNEHSTESVNNLDNIVQNNETGQSEKPTKARRKSSRGEIQTDSSLDLEPGYRSDTSDNEDDIDELELNNSGGVIIINTTATTSSDKNEKPVARLKRSISGKFRKNNNVNEGSSGSQSVTNLSASSGSISSPALNVSPSNSMTTSPGTSAANPNNNSSPGGSGLNYLGSEFPFHKAIRQGATKKQLSKLIKKYPIDQINSEGQTALHICASKGLLECGKLLIKKNANVNIQDNKGYTPLLCAALESKLELCKLLLETKTIKPAINNNQNSSVLHYLVRTTVDEDNLILYRSILDLLIEKGIDINQCNTQKEAPLHLACFKSNIAAASFLLERAVDCNATNSIGDTSLHYAARYGSIQLVRMLMENGADPTVVGQSDGFTPIDAASHYGHTDVLDCLQSIIEEEISFSPMSPRVKLNEHIEIATGWIYVLVDHDWKHLYVVLNKHRVICYSEADRKSPVIYSFDITHRCQITSEEGSIIDGDEQLWCFTLSETIRAISFATPTPEVREQWIVDIEKVLLGRVNLYKIYEKLKKQAKPREKLRQRERQQTLQHARDGVRTLSTTQENYCKWIVSNVELAGVVLSEIVSYDEPQVTKALVKFLLHHNLLQEFLKSSLSHEIHKTTVGKTLFRETSISTLMLSSYLDLEEGREYLKTTILDLVNAIAGDPTLELNFVSGDKTPTRSNFDKLITMAQNFLDCVLSSANRCPILLRELMLHIRTLVDKMFPNMTHAIVGGFIFLRYICPAILSPSKIGFKCWETPPRVCVLITKVLQTVSNGVEFDGSKEDHMQRFNPFIKKNRLCVNVFFENITDPLKIAKAKQTMKPIQTQLSQSELANVEKIICSHIEEQRGKMAEIVCSVPAAAESDDENSSVNEESMDD